MRWGVGLAVAVLVGTSLPAHGVARPTVLTISGTGGDVWTLDVSVAREAQFFDIEAGRAPGPAGAAGGVLFRAPATADTAERTRGVVVINGTTEGTSWPTELRHEVIYMGTDLQLPAGRHRVTLIGTGRQTYTLRLGGSGPAPHLRKLAERSVTRTVYRKAVGGELSWSEPLSIGPLDWSLSAYVHTADASEAGTDLGMLTSCISGGLKPCLPLPGLSASQGSTASRGSGASYQERGFYPGGSEIWSGNRVTSNEQELFERHVVTVRF